MTLDLIPAPKMVRIREGFFTVPVDTRIHIQDDSLEEAALMAQKIFHISLVVRNKSRSRKMVLFKIDAGLRPGQYRIVVRPALFTVTAASPEAAINAVRTLVQIHDQRRDDKIPAMDIDDWPDFPVRGVYYDVARGRIPLVERLVEQVQLLAQYKVNQFQLYFEHTFLFPGNPEISKGVDPLSAEDILHLDRVCRDNHVELVPSLASFGHMQRILSNHRYRHMAEDLGIGKYSDPEVAKLPAWQRKTASTISPAHHQTYDFLDSLFSQFLPLFTSRKFNVCCDETFDLGFGQSMDLCRRKGRGRVYLDHVLRLRRLAARYGKEIMFWGDIIRKYPELLQEIPRDVTVLDWGYDHGRSFEPARHLGKAGLNFCVCPGTSSWVSLFPRIHESRANIHESAVAGRRYGAAGFLNTDWGDGGHYNFMEFSWYGYLFGAEQAWNTKADIASFSRRFLKLFLKCDREKGPGVLESLGDITHLSIDGYYQGAWLHIFFATPDSDLFAPRRRDAWISVKGILKRGRITLNRRFAESTLRKLAPIRAAFASAGMTHCIDPHGILPYWIFAVDTLIHAARKLAVLSSPLRKNRRKIVELADEMKGLETRFQALWLARNKTSELKIAVTSYRKAIRALETLGDKSK